ncbi:MAG: putative lipopolysaccharide heptosyltransferase III [Neisseria sp.]|nr:putative lipopolysaccharide heptosyltransferase III [Neisseria sp.]
MPKRVLIIQFGHHGDVLLATAPVTVMKKAHPDCEVDMLVYQETADVLRDNTDIARIHVVDRQWKKQGLRYQIRQELALAQALRARGYDVVVNLAAPWRAAALSKYSGAKKRIGYALARRDNAAWRWAHSDLVAPADVDTHVVADNLNSLKPLKLDFFGSYNPVNMAVSAATRASLQDKLRAQGWQGEDYVLVHPGSRWFFKCWEDEKFIGLLQKLLDRGENIVLTASPDAREKAMIEMITGRLKTGGAAKLWVLSGCLSLRELAAAIGQSKLFIGVDSVPMHMAAAFDKPQVALFGPSWVNRWRPYSKAAEVVWAGDYGALPHPDSINTDDQTRLLGAIPVDAVWQAVEKKLDAANQPQAV